MKNIKKILIVLVAIFGIFTNIIPVNAETLSVSGTVSATSTVVGNTITVTFKFSSNNPLGAVVYSMSYDSNYLTLTSGTQSNALSYTGSQKSDSVKFTFKAKAKGNTTITFKINEALDFDGNALSAGNSSKTITIKSQADVEASYSKNNNLTSLTLSSGELSPAFNKDTLEYSATVENEVGQIEVSGKKEDSKSYVDGFKTYDLEEGNNRIEVKVTAQNGSAKTYVINVTRKELAPIIVKTEDGLELSVVRKKDLLKSPNANYEETTIKINEEEIPGFFNKATNTYLVGLKNEDGVTSLYTYSDNKYTKYKEILFNSIIITTNNSNDIPKGYKEETIKIGEEEVVAYKDEENNDEYYLLNGINIATGEEHLYQYDKKENTLQIFNSDLLTKIDVLNDKNNNYLYVIIGLGCLLILTYIVLLISSIKKNKKKIKSLDDDLENTKKEKKKKKKGFDFGDDNVSILDVKLDDKKEEIKEDIKENEDTVNEVKEAETDIILEETPEKKEEVLENTKDLQEKKKKKRKPSKEIEKKIEKDVIIKEDISNE